MIPSATTPAPAASDAVIEQRYAEALTDLHRRTDRFFARLMLVQWAATIALALIVSPRTWEGRISSVHLHVWAAIFLGGAVTIYPAWLGFRQAGRPATRHVLAIAQMLISALLIHLTGGRIETHFHIFGSLAFLAFYRDVRVLATATVVVYIDHLARGFFWPESVYGVLVATPWRSIEHAFWVLFEVAFLSMSIRVGLKELRGIVARQVALEDINRLKEQEVRDRTGELAQTEERLRLFFQNSPIGLYRASPAGEFQIANPTLLKILGCASLADLRVVSYSAPDAAHDAKRREFIAQLAASDQVFSRDTTWMRTDGLAVHVHESVRAFRDSSGNIVHVDGTVEDITERRQLEERYFQAQKVQAIGQLAGGVAHDFNNILTAINGYGDLLLRRPCLDEEARGNVSEILYAGQRAANLTQQLLAFSRKQRLQPRVIRLDAVVAEMNQMLQRLVGEHIQIRTVTSADLAAVTADPGQIQQVVMNLVVNARDAMTQGGRITIETSNVSLDAEYARVHSEVTPGRYAMLAVSDTGAGMTPEVQTRAFEPFFTTKAPGYGTGLGLATCHGIVKQSGGHIAVYSEVGHGTTFKIYLPAVGVMPESVAAPAPAVSLKGAGETVLLVEDDRNVREIATRVLTSLGYSVVAANNGLEALTRFTAHPDVALLITDVVMPDMGGRELVRRVREFAPHLRVLFTSGYTFDTLGDTDQLEAGSAFLAKPYGFAQLGESVHELLRQPAGAPNSAGRK